LLRNQRLDGERQPFKAIQTERMQEAIQNRDEKFVAV
jgi:hypothetical protein